ncbi:noncanonical pyrimidine nucleotidase, YjjG family [Ammoniphilus oxalaticus]|uniref:Noncanonical pyrimidine nucleotidase, YjjG family n=1 Tax=Ammoniphilus oxalaticus TaxID=66863 RepID=A0A419SP17_9BACL|nr:YjjG family noncanonical pyrimidine nucleotidase [Ammoniphilus oxalaticus]RKD25961.1 noncanonical pyrimidine nucleotidase, YjjG family [Ammoniphilus oxalaticus]
MKYDTILFDVDDTLFDFNASQKSALHKAFLQYGFPTGVTDFMQRYKEISHDLWRLLEQGQLDLEDLGVERFKRLFEECELKIDAGKFNQVYLNFLGKEAHLVDGAETLCSQLSPFRLAVITNGFKKVQHSRIALSPLCDTFQHIFTSEEAGYQKPDRRIFDFVFTKLELSEQDKDRVLIVGDSLTSDIQGGANYGIDTCWFNPRGTENETSIQPTYEIQMLTDLTKILLQ